MLHLPISLICFTHQVIYLYIYIYYENVYTYYDTCNIPSSASLFYIVKLCTLSFPVSEVASCLVEVQFPSDSAKIVGAGIRFYFHFTLMLFNEVLSFQHTVSLLEFTNILFPPSLIKLLVTPNLRAFYLTRSKLFIP